jgi:hypothetical protein
MSASCWAAAPPPSKACGASPRVGVCVLSLCLSPSMCGDGRLGVDGLTGAWWGWASQAAGILDAGGPGAPRAPQPNAAAADPHGVALYAHPARRIAAALHTDNVGQTSRQHYRLAQAVRARAQRRSVRCHARQHASTDTYTHTHTHVHSYTVDRTRARTRTRTHTHMHPTSYQAARGDTRVSLTLWTTVGD